MEETMSRKLFAALSVLILASLACSFSYSSGDGSTSEEQPSNVLFSDDFSDPSSGWGKQLYEDGTLTDYANGQYQIIVNSLESFYWGFTGRAYPNDVSIEVDVTPQAGTPEFGPPGSCAVTVKWRYFQLYMLTITNNGSADPDDREQQPGASANCSRACPCHPDGAVTNHLRADCIGTHSPCTSTAPRW
jgi:hypothetical protein